MSGEEMASNYSFGEYDDFSEYDILPENDHDSVSLYAGSSAIPKSNILVLSDIEESFVVLGQDILKSIREFSSEETPEPTRSPMDYEKNSESATSFPKEARMPSKILAQSEDVGVILRNTKKTTSNLKDVTERFRSTSSPLLCDSDSASPSNEAFFNSTAKNHTKNVDVTERQNKLLKEIKQILQQKGRYELEKEVQKARHESEEEVQKSKIKEKVDHKSTLKVKVSSIVDNLIHNFNHGTKVTNRLEHRDPSVPSEIKLKNDNKISNAHDARNEPQWSTSETLKIQELKKIIDESLLDELNIDKRSKQLLHNFKNSIEMFENSYCDTNSKVICASYSNANEFNNPHENLYKGLIEKNAKALNYAILINCIFCFVFMILMYFWGVILLDVLKMCDKIIHTTSKIEKFNNDPFSRYF